MRDGSNKNPDGQTQPVDLGQTLDLMWIGTVNSKEGCTLFQITEGPELVPSLFYFQLCLSEACVHDSYVVELESESQERRV